VGTTAISWLYVSTAEEDFLALVYQDFKEMEHIAKVHVIYIINNFKKFS